MSGHGASDEFFDLTGISRTSKAPRDWLGSSRVLSQVGQFTCDAALRTLRRGNEARTHCFIHDRFLWQHRGRGRRPTHSGPSLTLYMPSRLASC